MLLKFKFELLGMSAAPSQLLFWKKKIDICSQNHKTAQKRGQDIPIINPYPTNVENRVSS